MPSFSYWRLSYYRGEHKIYYDKKGRPYIILDKGCGTERRRSLRGHSSILRRTVQFDRKGVFVYFGGFRFRPKGKTKAVASMEVGLVSPYQDWKIKAETVVHIGNESEVWASR